MLPIAKGILTALIMTVGVGPGMLINFHTSLRRGFVAGLFVVAGLYASDFTFIAINYFGVFRVIQSFQHQHTGSIVCGSVLCIFGILMLLKKPAAVAASEESKPLPRTGSLLKGFLSGYVVNISNPFVFVFWMTLMSVASLNFGFRTAPFYVYFSAVICTALCLDIAKSYLFSRLKNGIREKIMKRINSGIGTILASAGAVIICRSLFIISQPLRP